MKKEDFPLLVYEGVRYRMVPELPLPHLNFRCEGCAACPLGAGLNREFCGRLCRAGQAIGPEMDCSLAANADSDAAAHIYIPEETFQEYVVELVRRRVS